MIEKQDVIYKSCSASISNNDYSEKHDTSYYQTLPPSDYNQHQNYLYRRTTPLATYRTDYDKEKLDKYGVNQSGIPLYDIKQLPIFPLSKVKNFIKKNPTFYYENNLKTETCKIPQLKTQPKLQ